MAKGQKRSNREHRKPKQEKAPPKPEASFSSQLKAAANTNMPRRRDMNSEATTVGQRESVSAGRRNPVGGLPPRRQ